MGPTIELALVLLCGVMLALALYVVLTVIEVMCRSLKEELKDVEKLKGSE